VQVKKKVEFSEPLIQPPHGSPPVPHQDPEMSSPQRPDPEPTCQQSECQAMPTSNNEEAKRTHHPHTDENFDPSKFF
jgi:hypothetical protein